MSVWGPQHTEDTIFHSARKRLERTSKQKFVDYNLEKRIEFDGLQKVRAEFDIDGIDCPFCHNGVMEIEVIMEQ